MYGRDETKELTVATGNIGFRASNGIPFIIDYESRRRRKATIEDARNLVLLSDNLDGYDLVHSIVMPKDKQGRLRNILLFINSHRHSLKPSDILVTTAAEVRCIAQIVRVIRGNEKRAIDKPLTAIDVSMDTPLRCAQEQVEVLLESARCRIPIKVLTSPAMGLTAPITIVGSVVLGMAEVIAAICLIYQLAPGLGVINSIHISPIDMRSTAINYGAPELGMGSVLANALSSFYKIPTCQYGFGTSSKGVDEQTAMEKMCSGLLLALSQPHMVTGGAVLDNALTTSPEQLVIDNEAIRFIKRIRKPLIIDYDSIGLNDLIEGIKSMGTMLAAHHTLRYLRSGELIDASLNQWCSYPTWEQDGYPDLFDRAHAKVVEVLSSHHVDPFPRDLDRTINRIIKDSLL